MTDLQFTEVIKLIAGGLYAAFGGMTHYLYQKSKNPHMSFSLFMMCIHMLVSFFVGQVVWTLIPPDYWWRGGDGLVIIGAF